MILEFTITDENYKLRKYIETNEYTPSNRRTVEIALTSRQIEQLKLKKFENDLYENIEKVNIKEYE